MLIALVICAVLALDARRSRNLVIDDELPFTQGKARTVNVYEGLSLAPGVYEVCLQYDTSADYAGHCTVQDDTLHAGLLRTNGEHFYAGKGQTGYTVWLFAPTETLRVEVSYEGAAYLRTGSLVIRNTGKLWTMLAVWLLFVAACVEALRLLARYARARQTQASAAYPVASQMGDAPGSRIYIVAAALLLITFAASLSQLGDYLLGGADLTYHLQRIEGVKDSIRAGVFPVRIEPEWLYGHGYASGIFYCDALLYLPALLRLAGVPITTAYNIYCICLNFATAWIAWYCFGKILRDWRVGLWCSALYTLSIVRIYKLAIVGAVGEGSAITFLPLVFYGMVRVLTEDTAEKAYRTAWLPLALGYAGLIQTHVLTCEITAFLTLLTCVVCIRRILRRPVFFMLAKGALGALGLSMWYLIPFLDYYLTQDMHIRHVSGRTIQERGLYPVQLLINTWSEHIIELLEAKGYEGIETIAPGTLPVCGLLMFGLLWIFMRRKLSQAAKLSALYAALLLCMTLRVFPWNTLQNKGAIMASLISSLQFPNRFLGWAMVFLTMVCGTCLCVLLQSAKPRLVAGAATLLLAASVLSGSLYLLRDASGEEHRIYLYNEAGMGFGYISGAEYLVQGTQEAQLTFAGPVCAEGVRIEAYTKRYQTIRCTCVNETAAEAYVDLPLLLYKGYQAVDEQGQRLSVTDGENHLVRVQLPAGFAGELVVRFVSPFYWRIGEWITLLTAAGIVVYKLTIRRRICYDENND